MRFDLLAFVHDNIDVLRFLAALGLLLSVIGLLANLTMIAYDFGDEAKK